LYDASKGNFKSWLFKLTQNLYFDAVRKLDKMNIVPMSIELLHVKADHSKEIHHAELKVIRHALKHLNDRDRQLLVFEFEVN
jgi:DNA-directed RNA polymerase specialized sigma24 family protein